jgi:replicative DNA helicase
MPNLPPIAEALSSDKDQEQALLCCILINPKAIEDVGRLQPEDFSDPLHGSVFATMLRLRDEKKAINSTTISTLCATNAMSRKSILDALNGLSFSGDPPPVEDISAYLMGLAIRRNLSDVCQKFLYGFHDGSQKVGDVFKAMISTFNETYREEDDRKSRYSWEEAVDEMLENMRADHSKTLVPTRIRALDFALAGGLRRKLYTVMAGRPGMGKTALALAIAVNVAQSGIPVAYFSLEMSASSLAQRAISAKADVEYERVYARQLSEADDASFQRQAGLFLKLPITIEERAALTAAEIGAMVAALKDKQPNLGLVIVDHMAIIKPPDRYKGNRVNEMTEISAQVRAIAKREDVAMLALHQLSRAVEQRENKRPIKSDLRDSGSIEQDADTIMMLYREAYYLGQHMANDADEEARRMDRMDLVSNEVEVILNKNRHGAERTVKLWCDMGKNQISDPKTDGGRVKVEGGHDYVPRPGGIAERAIAPAQGYRGESI